MNPTDPQRREAVEVLPEKNYYWSNDEEHIQGGPFDTLEQCYSDAYCHRAVCFDDPSQQDCLYVHHGFQSPNPDYEPNLGYFDEDNHQFILNGETTTKVDALTVTDYFHDQYVKIKKDLTPPPVESEVAEARPYPDLLNDQEKKDLLESAEVLWAALQTNQLGGYSGINRPFYILNQFKWVIEVFGKRDVGLHWSKDDLDKAAASSVKGD